MKQAAKVFLGSCAVYVLVAACSSGGGPSLGDGEPPDGAGGQGGAPVAMAGASGRGQGAGGAGVAGMPGVSGAAGAVAQAGASGSSGSPGAGGAGGIFNPVPDADAATPGTRLKPKVFVGADGSRQPTQLWSDTQRGGEECSFRRAADGVYRCLPTATAFSPFYYQDSGCQNPVYLTPKTCTTVPTYVTPLAHLGFTCAAGERIFTLGAKLTSMYGGEPGFCSGSPTFSANADPYPIIEVPPASFAAAELRVE